VRESEYKLLIQESNIKPNRYVVRAMCLISLVAIFVLMINEMGFFRVNKILMRRSIFISLFLLIPP